MHPPTPVHNTLRRFLVDESGQDLIEYALVAGLIGIAAIAVLRGLSTKVSTSVNTIGNTLTNTI